MHGLSFSDIYSGNDSILLHTIDGDLPGCFLDVNAAACRHLGYTRDELLKMSPRDIDAPDVWVNVPDIMRKLMDEKAATWEGVHLNKARERIPVEINAHMFELNGRRVVLSIVRDIRERRQAEEAVWESENKFRSLFEHMNEGVALHEIVYDERGEAVDYRILSVNPAFGRHSGIAVDGFSGRLASEIYGTGVAPYLDRYARVARTGEPFAFDTFFEPLKKYFSISVFSPKKGQFATVFSDITERKRAEDELRLSQQIIKDIINAISVRVFWKDKNLVYLGCNAVFARDAGFSDPAEIIGKDDYQMGWRDQAELYRSDDRAVIESGSPKMFIEESQTTPDGRTITLLTTKVPLRGPEGEIKGVLGTYVDITERKQMEEELIKAQKLDSLGVLAGGIAHDFNNILTGIVGNISMARESMEEGSEPFKILKEAEAAVFQARTLTQQLLTFAKGGAPVKKPAALGDIVTEAAVFATRGTKTKCEFRIAEDLNPGLVDSGQIGQVIHNLAINAVQAMPDGGTISIQADNLDVKGDPAFPLKAGRYVRIVLTDTGVGIPAEHLGKIFDPYFSTKQTGSGLGLATCYSIIKKHDGLISVESELGKGTSFSIYLPVYLGKVDVPVRQKSPEVIKGSGRILVMDDEPVICTFLTKILKQLGYELETTPDGDLALARYRETWKTKDSFDAVILDLTVPGGKGGQEVIKELREINPDIKALVSSGYADDPIMANFKDYGFSAVLSKPYNAQELSQVLHQLLTQ